MDDRITSASTRQCSREHDCIIDEGSEGSNNDTVLIKPPARSSHRIAYENRECVRFVFK